jgi:DNA-binding LacI/PurR family transcriptional regulator
MKSAASSRAAKLIDVVGVLSTYLFPHRWGAVIATIHDVAALAGVSIATVSRVLNNPSIVREDKREAVTAAVAELDFRPNYSARTLKSKTFGSIALIVSNLANTFFAEMVNEIEGPLAAEGYDILLCNTDMQRDRLVHYLRQIPQRGVDAVIISGSTFLDDPQIIELLSTVIERGIPVICSGAPVHGLSVPTVVTDSTIAMHDLAAHLVSTNRTRIAYLGGREHASLANHRLNDLAAGLAEFGVQLDERLTMDAEYGYAAGENAIARLLEIDPDLNAVVCGGDQMALGAMRGLRRLGRDVPGDVSVTGFDDIQVAGYANPSLTSISVKINEIALALTENALSSIAGENDRHETRISSELIVRQSSSV